MLIQVHTDNHVRANEKLREEIEGQVTRALGHVSEQISRVEVHLGDESGNKQSDNDKRCTIEAHIGHLRTVAVTEHARSMVEALDGAIDKLQRAVESALEKAHDHRSIDRHA